MDANALVDAVVGPVRSAWPRAYIVEELRASGAAPLAPERIARALARLLIARVRAAREGDVVLVRTFDADGRAFVEVSSAGVSRRLGLWSGARRG